MFYSCEKSILKKIKTGSSHWEISISCTIQEIDNVMCNTLLASFCSIMIFFCQVVARGRLKTIIENCKLLALKSGCGCFQEVVAYKRLQTYWCDLETFGILENWSLRSQVVATDGSIAHVSAFGFDSGKESFFPEFIIIHCETALPLCQNYWATDVQCI